MPIKSARQYRLMQMAAHNPEKMKSMGPSEAVAKEMIAKTPSKKRKRLARVY